METQPENIMICNLEVLLMPNGEVIHKGVSIGWFDDLKKYLTPKQ
jgi:hypothetical protein